MNLLSSQAQGALYAILIFFACVVVVHGYKLAKIGWRSLHKKLPPEKPRKKEKTPEPVYYIKEVKPEKPKKKEKAPEPVYYIVERKVKKRAKTEYSEPKRIKFHSK